MKLIKALVFAFLSILAATIVVAVLQIAPIVRANPDKCPPGQEKQSGCVWVQHGVTGRCQWLPDHAVASPWHEVPEGSCPALAVTPSYTPFKPIAPTLTCTPRASDPPKPVPTSKTDPPTKIMTALPTSAPTSCDDCDLVHGVQTLAAVESTRLSREQTREPVPNQ